MDTSTAPGADHGRAADDISYRTRKWVKPEDLNANGTLFGGSLLRWIDEEAAIYAIIQLGKSLNLSVVAEGVESEEQAALLLRHGCRQAQGYLYSRPLAAGDILSRWGRTQAHGHDSSNEESGAAEGNQA